MSSCCTLRLKRRRAFSRDSPSCSRISAKQTHPQTRPDGPSSYYKELTGSQVEEREKWREWHCHGFSLTPADGGPWLELLLGLGVGDSGYGVLRLRRIVFQTI